MMMKRWLGTGGPARGTPARCRSSASRPLAVVVLASACLVQAGCQSGPCAGGGGLFGPCGFFSRTSTKFLNRNRGGCCGGADAAGVEYGAPAVIAPGAVAVPAPGAVLPGPAESAPVLEPATPSATPAPSNGS